MKELRIEPQGWPCKLEDLRPGLFMADDTLCFKSQYGDIFVVSAGCYLNVSVRSDDAAKFQPVETYEYDDGAKLEEDDDDDAIDVDFKVVESSEPEGQPPCEYCGLVNCGQDGP